MALDWSRPGWVTRWRTETVVGWATLGPVGRLRPGPGTWGSGVGVGIFVLAYAWAGTAVLLAGTVVAAWFAVVICGEAERRMGRRDPGEIILDEAVAVPLAFLAWPTLRETLPAGLALFLGFAFFRLFDIAKPLGIHRLQALPGGIGVVVDDLVAAMLASVSLHAVAAGWAAWRAIG
jgi:phosphatidylglycerophosphatase A